MKPLRHVLNGLEANLELLETAGRYNPVLKETARASSLRRVRALCPRGDAGKGVRRGGAAPQRGERDRSAAHHRV